MSHETFQLLNSYECLLPYIILDIKVFLHVISLKTSFSQIYFTLKSILQYNWHTIFCIILFYIIQLNLLWKKTFPTIHQLSCFVGHPVFIYLCEEPTLGYNYVQSIIETLTFETLFEHRCWGY